MAEWDARPWSLFIFIITTVVWLCGFVTPFDMVGNSKDPVIIAFGGNVQPKHPGTGQPMMERFGLWGEVGDRGYMLGVQVIMCLALAFIVVCGIGYGLLFFRNNNVAQIIALLSQLLTGIMTLVGIGVFRANTDKMGEGFWMVATAGGLFIINGIVLIFLPLMEHNIPKWVMISEDQVPLKKKGAEDV